jgi:hypothetical protein
MSNYFHISLTTPLRTPPTKQLEPIIGVYGDDWVRYSANSWIIYSKHTATSIFKAIKPYLQPGEQALVIQLASPAQAEGLLPQWIWNWIHKKR